MSTIHLVACGKRKGPERTHAADLYTGPLFRARREYAEATGSPWWILSARYGFVHPDQLLDPYDETLKGKRWVDRAAWAVNVVAGLLDELPDHVQGRNVTVEVHAGCDYRNYLMDVLHALGITAWCPTLGLGIGEQRAWYRKHTGRARRVGTQ